MSQITKKDILDRLKALITTANKLKINDGKMWWRIGAHYGDELPTLSLNEQIDVSDEDMARALGSTRWTALFKKNRPISAGFIHGNHGKTQFVSVCEANDSIGKSPTTSTRMNPKSAMRRKVDVELKEVINIQEQRLKRAYNDKPSPTNTAPVAATKVSPSTNTPASTSNQLNQKVHTIDNTTTTTKRDVVSINNGEEDNIESPPKKMKSSIGIADLLSGSTEKDGKNKEGGLVVDIDITEEDITKLQDAALSFLSNQLAAHTNEPSLHIQNFTQSILSRLVYQPALIKNCLSFVLCVLSTRRRHV